MNCCESAEFCLFCFYKVEYIRHPAKRSFASDVEKKRSERCKALVPLVKINGTYTGRLQMMDEKKSLISLKIKVYQLVLILLSLILGYVFIKFTAPLHEIVMAFATAVLLSYLLASPVAFMTRFIRFRAISVGLIFLAFVALISLLVYKITPVIALQVKALKIALPNLISNVDSFLVQISNFLSNNYQIQLPLEYFDKNQLLSQLMTFLTSFNILGFGDTLGGVIFNSVTAVIYVVLTVILSFYMLVDGDRAWKLFLVPFSDKIKTHMGYIKAKIDISLHAYIVGQFEIASLTSLVMLVTYLILGVPYALLFAFAQMLEIIPVIGTWAAIVPCISIIFFTSGASKAFLVLAIYLIYSQFIRDNFIAPKVMGNALGFHPLAIILAIIIGATLKGAFGVIFALPILAMAAAIVDYFVELRRLKVQASRGN